MNKRLRKKKRVGEFMELSFEVRGSLRPGLGRAELEAFVERFIAEVEAHQLSFGGGIGDALDGFATRNGRASATEDDRAARRDPRRRCRRRSSRGRRVEGCVAITSAPSLEERLENESDPARRMELVEEALCPPEPHLLDTCVLQNLDWIDRKIQGGAGHWTEERER